MFDLFCIIAKPTQPLRHLDCPLEFWIQFVLPLRSGIPNGPMKRERTVELFLREGRSKGHRAAGNLPVGQIPKIGCKFSLEGRSFLVKEVTHLVLRHGKKRATQGVVLTVDDVDALKW